MDFHSVVPVSGQASNRPYRCTAGPKLRVVQGHLDSWGVTPAPLGVDSPLSSLAAAFRAALAAPDVRGARTMVREAAQAGAPAGRLYVDVVRPALVELQSPGRTVGARLAAGIGEAILADLVAHLPAAGAGARRAAVLSCRDRGIEAVDGTVAMDFLEAAGWTVRRLQQESPERDVPALVGGDRVGLAVAVANGPADALRLAPICTELRRLADPPVIVLCDFSGRPHQRTAFSSLGADAVAHDPDELLPCAAQRLPGAGMASTRQSGAGSGRQ
jgi:hypothetical protein